MVRQGTHVPALDGIRGLAILAVLFCHSAPAIPDITPAAKFLRLSLHTGWIGVDLFFVLSGFLISSILLQTKGAPNYFRTFYMRRVLRIFPLYYAFLLAIFIVIPHTHFAPWIPENFSGRMGFFAFLQNFPAFSRFEPGRPDLLRHLWSLAVEEQFYLVWPLLVLLLPNRRIAPFCCGLLALLLPMRILAVAHWGSPPGFFYLTSTRCDGLLIGAAIAVVSQERRIPMRIISLAAALGCAAWVYLLMAHPGVLYDESTDAFIDTFGVTALALFFGAVLAFSQYRIQPFDSLLCSRFLRTFGKYSYGIYVFHFVLFVFLQYLSERFLHLHVQPFSSVAGALLYIAISIALVYTVAWASYEFFEVRFLRLKRFFVIQSASIEPAANPGTPVAVEQR